MDDAEFNRTVEDLRAKGYEIERPVKEYEGWVIGERVAIKKDSSDGMMIAGDEGVVVPEVCGDKKHGNERTALYVWPEGMDSPVEVDWADLESV